MSRDLAERATELVAALDSLRGQMLWVDDDGKGTLAGVRSAHEALRDALAESTPAAPDEEGLDALAALIKRDHTPCVIFGPGEDSDCECPTIMPIREDALATIDMPLACGTDSEPWPCAYVRALAAQDKADDAAEAEFLKPIR